MHIVDTIHFWARTTPHRAAIVQPELVTTYQALSDAIESIAARIERLGLDRSGPVAVAIANPSMLLATLFALSRTGYAAAPINLQLYPHLPAAGIRNLIYDMQGQMLSGGRNIRFDLSWLPQGGPGAPKRAHPKSGGGNLDTVFFTSGTTGLPKKIVQSGGALDVLLTYPFTCATGAQQKILIMPGLATTFGFNRVCEVLNLGKTACFAPNIAAALALVGAFGIEVIVASAAQALALAELKRKDPSVETGSLATVLVGGGRIAPQQLADVRAALCRNLLSQYGSTEGGVVALAPFEQIAAAPGAVGFVLPWAEVEIVDEGGRMLPPGAEGLIRYRTPQLAENLKAGGSADTPGVRGAWFYPGDIGTLTADGVLCLAGRSSDVINRGGLKVSGTRIEEILQALPQIKEAAACGVAGPSGLEEIWIAIVPRAPVAIDAIKRHLADHDDIKIAPDEVLEFAELPRGDLGKVQKLRLKEMMLDRKRQA